ncbi:hypothetical protein ABVV53_14270 [Novosphingobium sp. RD2P27]|uniref:DUF5666 domain-containing protein n=1 Tax=Novosphingobium kalidii TaxID=3230299 RepID=A0ABV2D413_9SPHN
MRSRPEKRKKDMAEIPIEKRKGGVPWWVWLLILAAIVALLIWLFAGREEPVVENAELDNDRIATAGAVDPGMGENTIAPTEEVATGGPITDLSMLLGSQADAVIGREVRLTNVPAGPVPADAGFWIMGDNGQREYVILHEVRTPNTPIEGKIDVDEGDRLDIVGTVRSAERGVPTGAAIPPPTDPLPAGVNHYIEAQSVTKAK